MGELENLTLATFAPLVGQRFQLRVDDSSVIDTVLAEAAEPPPRSVHTPGHAGRSPFSIVFRGPAQPVLPQRTYCFTHDALGSFELFIVPIGPDDEGMRYEAVFG